MKRTVFALALAGSALLTTVSISGEPTKAETKLTNKDIAKLMKETHVGAKSPHALTLQELGCESPDWERVVKDAKAFVTMGESFKKTDLGYTSPDKYIAGAAALSKAASAKNKKAATDAFTSLTKSCSACHYGDPSRK
ncbi:hypothetical protein GobsT_65690 [Gemmata obscuriglobus]|uniref:Cytochrome C n=1 Tax=Gemmata obscuriglobus TaxID=114 RepID=A0A2Z3H442_9BACT|nr:cytochrome c [Gemmata obscuriglobus]AWM35740.1 hypothetical protein C1280_01010 [Gemmata obscuriglobus]QEG31725.1 hypothetical protein GobsT_65690 [Gemmata obscuriglobus]VTS11071.1 hypothetical protein : Cytochrome C OS=Singulisphaera acidiphila (strain ATCC BAA-1392 / DSM 18658 / VKM B-2454 / MOB10) GN=Sinac_3849 PE=4 SV=1 [Gemmata obscuriglobus UQM 2246]